MESYRTTRWALAPVLICLLARLAGVTPAIAADPSEGTISSATPTVFWTGEYRQAAEGTGCSRPLGDPLEYCDRFTLRLDLPADHWSTDKDGLVVQLGWEDPADVFRLCVRSPAGDQVCDGGNDGPNGVRTGSRYAFLPRAPNGEYAVTVQYEAVIDSDYRGSAAASLADPDSQRVRPDVVFDRGTEIAFAPATVVSPHFLGTEPMMAVERPSGDTAPGALDPDRIFVDWPLGSTSATGQLSRSEDGGDSFRLLFDVDGCPERNRPNCDTAGGGDTDVAVNPVNGNVYFSDLETLGNVAFASSTDHGDTFPSSRQHVISSTATAIDRQWVVGAPPGLVKVDHDRSVLTPDVPIEAFLSYEVGLLSKAIQGIDATGRPVPQEVPQIPDGSGRTGPVRIDASQGPGRGWLYQPAGDREANGRYGVATVHASNYQKGVEEAGGWEVTSVADRPGRYPLFSWVELDARGNAYTVWLQDPEDVGVDDGWRIHYSFSAIDDPRNHPATGRPGTIWSAPVTVSLPELGSTIFPQVTAGDAGRVAISYMGTEDHVGDPQEAPGNARWDVYTAVITDALASTGELRIATGKVNHRTAHTGTICWGGAGCEVGVPEDPTGLSGTGDRSLADMMDIGVDANGRVAVVYGDNHSTFAYVNPTYREKPFPHFAKQTSGPSLLRDAPDVQVAPANGSVTDPSGDATWPNRSDGRYLPSLDVLGASLDLEGGDLVARIPLRDTTVAQMSRDLEGYQLPYPSAPSPRRLQYVLRFLTDQDVYHVSMEQTTDGNRRFFGGKLDANDRLMTSDSYEFVNGAGYHSDATSVSGVVEDGALVLRAPAADFGLAAGSEVYSVTAFAMAGPREADETALDDIMRTVDATPPFDQTLGAPEPTPTATAPETPTTSPSAGPWVFGLELSPPDQVDAVGAPTTVTALVTDQNGNGVSGAAVVWDTKGVGHLTEAVSETDQTGRATAVLLSDEPGDQWVTASSPSCASGAECIDTSVRHHGPESCDVFGTRRSDLLRGTWRAEVICTFGGNDVVLARGGNDLILGAGGNDRLYGNAGRDRIFGGRGADEVRGGSGGDNLFGGRGIDFLLGGFGRDVCVGGEKMKSCRR